MVLMPVLCPHCHSDHVIRGGKTKAGQQRYKCQNTACPHYSFQLELLYKGRAPAIKEQIVDMSLNPSMWPQLSSPFARFFVFSYLYRSSLTTIGRRHAHTDNVDRWIGYAPHSPCGCLRLLGLAPSSLFWARHV
jgi:InsA N-terminal domain